MRGTAPAKAPFHALNCAAIPENLLESELFGHEKGAFTGADRRHIGKFEQCNGGTFFFLDKVGDMPLALQAKMLRVLQEQAFEWVGGNETVRTDVRLIATWRYAARTSRPCSRLAVRRCSPPSCQPFRESLPGPMTAPQSAAGDPDLEAFIRLRLASGGGDLYAETHRKVDLLLLTRVLEDTGGNQHQAALRLGIGRETLRRRLRELGLHVSRRLEEEYCRAGTCGAEDGLASVLMPES